MSLFRFGSAVALVSGVALVCCLTVSSSCAPSTTPPVPDSHPANPRGPEASPPDTSGVLKPDAQDQPSTVEPNGPDAPTAPPLRGGA